VIAFLKASIGSVESLELMRISKHKHHLFNVT
jgi:hypothetical protein